jgi:Protein of unknown function (DUF2723)
LALLGLFVLLCEWRLSPPIAAGTVFLLALLFPFWYYASVAELYAMIMALIVLTFLIAARWQIDRRPRYLIALAFVFGLAVGHHRLAVVAAPALAIYTGPLIISTIRQRPILVLAAGLSLCLSLLIYIYLPLRAGSAWVYGDPSTWGGLWRIITAQEYNAIIRPTSTMAAFANEVSHSIGVLSDAVTWPILITGAAGLAIGIATRAYRRAALSLMIFAITAIAFVSILSQAIFTPKALMPAMLALVPGVGILLQILTARSRLAQWIAGVAVVAGALGLIALNGPAIWSITHDPYGRELIDRVISAQLDQVSARPVVFSIWGRDYFALAYAHSVTGELSKVDQVDSHADVKTLIDDGQSMYVLPAALYYERRSTDWWDKRLGRAYLSSYTGELVHISDQPILSENDLPPDRHSVPMGSSIVLRAWQVRSIGANQWQVTLYWQALAKPDRDYSVFVHASDRDVIDSPDAIIAQADSDAPVYGWYPTSNWSPNEIIRDDHVLVVPADRVLKTIAVGLYYQDESGAFHNLGQQVIPIPALP